MRYDAPMCRCVVRKFKTTMYLNINMLRYREGRSNAHLNGDYQRIGDVFINTLRVLQVVKSRIINTLMCGFLLIITIIKFEIIG